MTQPEKPPSMYRAFKEGFQETQQFNQMAEAILKAIRGVFYLLVCSLSFAAEVFLRRRLGERYFTIFRAFLGMMTIYIGHEAALYMKYRDASIFYGLSGSTPERPMFYGLFLAAYLLATVAHYAFFKWRVRRGTRWHSRSSGIPHLMLIGYGYWRTVQIVEPTAVFVAGFTVLMLMRAHFGYFLIAVSVAMLFKSALEYGDARRKLLDAIDSTIESEHMAEALDGTHPVQKTEGFVIPGASAWQPAERQTMLTLKDAFEALDPSLQDLIATKRFSTTPSGSPDGETSVTGAEPRPLDTPRRTDDEPPAQTKS